MDVDAAISRALSAVGQGIRYKLGKGGMKPGSPTPAAAGQCDCTGFVSWCFGMSRHTPDAFYVAFNGGWIETTAVWTDIGRSVGIFEQLDKPRRGAVVVFPDALGAQGHIGILTSASKVIHCSKGNDTRTGDAIQETGLAVFNRPDVRYGWFVGLGPIGG
ncbi:MAG TPA: CHAP domain-containing protein [Novosphingobium sp.]|nr:CHAP domain-containing protein [Novosphingobium sp.]